MTELIINRELEFAQVYKTGAGLTMTSLELLEIVNHARAEFGENSVRRVDFTARCKDELEGEYYETFVVSNPRGPATEALRLTQDQCMLVAMRESKSVRRSVLETLKRMGAAHVPKSLPEALRLAADLAEKAEALQFERDEAIRTKAQIGSRREATAMATASKAKREAERLRDELGFSARHATILQVEDATGIDADYVPLRRWCKANEVTPATVPDKRYPRGVKAWPAGAWLDVYGIDLGSLFGEAA